MIWSTASHPADGSARTIVQILPEYRHQLRDLLRNPLYIHQHSDWLKPEDVLDGGGAFLLTESGRPIGSIGFSQETDQIRWLQFFSVFRPVYPINAIWDWFWQEPAITHFLKNGQLFSIPLDKQMENLVKRQRFAVHGKIIYLEADEIQFCPEQVKPADSLYVSEVQVDDAEMVANILESAFPPVWRLSSQNIRNAIRTADLGLILRLNKQIAGYLLANTDDESVHISRIAIRTEMQKGGLGTALICEMVKRTSRKHRKVWSVNTYSQNDSAILFYKKLGFSQTERSYPLFRRDFR